MFLTIQEDNIQNKYAKVQEIISENMIIQVYVTDYVSADFSKEFKVPGNTAI